MIAASADVRTTGAARELVSRAEVEDFLYMEANLLDDWKLDEWGALFTDDATYEVPQTGASDDVDSSTSLFLVADDRMRIDHRIKRLKKQSAHSEWPRSCGVRSITNVRILECSESELLVRSVFVTYRSKVDLTDTYFGHHLYRLRIVDGQLRIASKRSILDMSSLRPQGRVSIIV